MGEQRRPREGPPADPDAQLLRRLGYAGPADLLLHLPLRYEDETRLTPLHEARPGHPALVEGEIVHAEVQNRPRRQLVVEVREATSDECGDGLPVTGDNTATHPSSPVTRFNPSLFVRLLHFYPNQLAQLKPGVRVRLFGEVREGFFGAEMVHPRLRIVRADAPLPTHLTPVYPSVAGLSQFAIQRAVERALHDLPLDETLPQETIDRLRLPGFAAAIRLLHAPPPQTDVAALEAHSHPAWRRLKFDELLAQQLSLRLHAQARRTLTAPVLGDDSGFGERLLATLPFALTAAQRRVLGEIRRDLVHSHPMHRLLQGDVGSGKTLVAALACLPAVAAGWQAAMMAPTEILAEQLYLKFRDWFEPLGIRVAWLAAASKGKARRETLAGLADGSAQVAVGTHALFQAGVEFHRLALAVVDEQHRFGVEQRLALRGKGSLPEGEGNNFPLTPHLLMMSATPIPRSLAMSYYADLDVSTLDELPPGRLPVATRLVGEDRRAEVVGRLRDYCAGGAQAYWVCPLIEESEKLDLAAALDTHAELVAALPGLRIGLAHGRLKADEKAAAMAAFKAGELDILVATTVIEVGVDVPNAGLMVIEHAERMGLAQLHQLRGRVGRGWRESTCLLLYAAPLSAAARQRLRVIRETSDGFAIAREDLRLRGPGEFMGARQSGTNWLRFASPELDADLLEPARDAAADLLAHHPEAVRRHLDRWLPKGVEYLRA